MSRHSEIERQLRKRGTTGLGLLERVGLRRKGIIPTIEIKSADQIK